MNIDKEIAAAHLRASGWDLGVFNGFSPFECHFVYVNDLDSGAVNLISLSQLIFDEITLSDEFESSHLASLIAQRVLNINPKDDILVPALVGYIKKSKAYDKWRVQNNSLRLHFFINIYGSKKVGKHPMLRPFISQSDDIIISSEEMLNFSNFVYQNDKERNPDWFR